MSQNTVEKGRTKAVMPEFRFDTVDGGENLYNVMAALFARFSDDSIRCRTKAFNITNTSSVTFAHNIGQVEGELEVKVFISGVELSEELVAAGYSIVHVDENTVTLTNNTGSSKAGWLVVSGVIHNRVDKLRLRGRDMAPDTKPGEVTIYCEDGNVYAKNEQQTVMALTDSTVIQAPPGIVLPYAGTAVPTGFLLCDGSLVSRTLYANLFAAIGTSHGAGDGVTTFHLPDYRGRFLRGVDGAAGRDPDKTSRTAANAGGNAGNAVGSVQSSQFGTHSHTQNAHNHTQDAHSHTQNAHNHTQDPHNHSYSSPYVGDSISPLAAGTQKTIFSSSVGVSMTTAVNQATTATNQATTATNQSTTAINQATGGNETRPVNANVNYIIKY